MLCSSDNVCLHFKEKRSEPAYNLSMLKEDHLFISCTVVIYNRLLLLLNAMISNLKCKYFLWVKIGQKLFIPVTWSFSFKQRSNKIIAE